MREDAVADRQDAAGPYEDLEEWGETPDGAVVHCHRSIAGITILVERTRVEPVVLIEEAVREVEVGVMGTDPPASIVGTNSVALVVPEYAILDSDSALYIIGVYGSAFIVGGVPEKRTVGNIYRVTEPVADPYGSPVNGNMIILEEAGCNNPER